MANIIEALAVMAGGPPKTALHNAATSASVDGVITLLTH
jgi:hypothetical protein